MNELQDRTKIWVKVSRGTQSPPKRERSTMEDAIGLDGRDGADAVWVHASQLGQACAGDKGNNEGERAGPV